VWEDAEQVARTLAAYRVLPQGELSPQAALKRVGVHEQYGITLLRACATRPRPTHEATVDIEYDEEVAAAYVWLVAPSRELGRSD